MALSTPCRGKVVSGFAIFAAVQHEQPRSEQFDRFPFAAATISSASLFIVGLG
jgi:hypothetical protein